ncbi:hypothetical protein FACS1894172_07090 [Spirochaetia bacterium]|nr:hypothetical protein FACS1894164_08810 [Spirochaetia bacterium]GHU31720.1 hypothetical protein FACS1894172_07090 [Spirochaetia bacterium]
MINKKAGLTSFQSLNQIKKDFSTPKVGHTGTLDKFASGLLVVLMERALKLARYFSDCDKEYTGTIRFGAETDTLDPEGAVIAEADPPELDRLLQVLPDFRGDIVQRPPEYSAIHIGGKRASALARAGTTVEMPARPVTIHALELLSYKKPDAKIRVHCSKGTYIRSLARDIGGAAGSCGHLIELTRTAVAGFSLEQADGNLHTIDPELFSLLGIPVLYVDEDAASGLIHGTPVDPLIPGSAPALTALFCEDSLVAIVEPDAKGLWRYGCVYAN